MMKNMKGKNNKKMIVTAICIATLGAQLAPVMNVQAATDESGNSSSSAPTSSSTSLQSSGSVSGSTGAESSTSGSTSGSDSGSTGSNNSTDTGAAGSASGSGVGSAGSTGATDDTTGFDNGSNGSSVSGQENDISSETSDADKAADDTTDKTVAAPVIVNNPAATKTNQEAGYADDKNKTQVEGHISVTNDSGTAKAKGTDIFNSSSIIESNDNNKISAVFTYTDDVPEADNTQQSLQSPTFYLPAYFATADTAADIVIDKGTSTDASDWQTTLLKNSGLPEGTIVKYTLGTANSNNTTFSTLDKLGTDLDISKVTGVQINYGFKDDGTVTWMPANSKYTVTIPLKVVSNDPNNANTSKIGVSDTGMELSDYNIGNSYNLYQNSTNRTTTFRIADKITNVSDMLTGALRAVTEQKTNVEYTNVDSDIQALMPTIEDGDVSYSNFNSSKADTTADNFYSGGIVFVNSQALKKVAKAVNDKGYSLLMNNDGTIGTGNYVYSMSDTNVVNVSGDSDTTESGTSEIAPDIYITLRQLINTKDSDITIGSTWKDSDNLADVTTVQDKATPATAADLTSDPDAAGHVTTEISDPDGVLDANGKAIKAGTFQVTYSVKDGNYTVSKTATITVKPSENTSSNSSGNNNQGGSSSNNQGSSNHNGQDNSGSTTTTTDPDEVPVVSPNEVPDEVPVVSPNEVPDVSTDNNETSATTTTVNQTNTTNENGNILNTASNAQTGNVQSNPVYTITNNANGILTGYSATNSATTQQASQQNSTIATFPQTGNANDSKLQVIGAMIISMMASVAGFAFGKKRHANKA